MGDLIGVNPLLGPLQFNGGPTETQALLEGSPAIEAGENAGCPATDQRGVARPQPPGGRCDIGAFEFVPAVQARCTSNSGTIKLSPGLTDTPAVQTMKIKGTLTGCGGDTFTGATYTATLKTEGPVSCSVLKGAGEAGTGSAKYKWTPKTKSSTGTLSLPLTETAGAALSGEVGAGSYSPLTLSGTATESYTGGATCGQAVGKKAAKAVKTGTFSGSAVNFE